MSKVRINDLARELEVKSKAILDALPKVGVTEKKTHSSSVEVDEAERVRIFLTKGSSAVAPVKEEVKPKIDFSKISKPGDIARLKKTGSVAPETPAIAKAPTPPPAATPAKPAVKTAPPAAVTEAPAKPAAPRVIAPKPRAVQPAEEDAQPVGKKTA